MPKILTGTTSKRSRRGAILIVDSLSLETVGLERLRSCLQREFRTVTEIRCNPQGDQFNWIRKQVEAAQKFHLPQFAALVGDIPRRSTPLNIFPGVRLFGIPGFDEGKWTDKSLTALEFRISNGTTDLDFQFRGRRLVSESFIPF